ncbi:MAG: hypothetical protein Q8Q81_10870 [Oxalobacteraceae bacterium]|nr:hypothetical protein [Oxalobacteraceae bacterium]
MDISNAPLECKFRSYKFGDDKGKLLADNAKAECMRNIERKKDGRGQEASLEAYNFWKDHSQMTAAKRSSSKTVNCVPNGFGGMRCN